MAPMAVNREPEQDRPQLIIEEEKRPERGFIER